MMILLLGLFRANLKNGLTVDEDRVPTLFATDSLAGEGGGAPQMTTTRCPRCLDDSASGLEPTSGVLKVHIEVLMLIGKRKGHIDLDFMMI